MVSDSSFNKVFSSADSLAFILFPESRPVLLGSLTSISYSINRDKKPVALIGNINVSGYTHGIRTIFGKMEFTLINQNLTNDLISEIPYLSNKKKINSDELPLFDIMIVSLNEYKYATQMMIYGIDITNDVQKISIDDIFVKNTLHFVAKDLNEFEGLKSSEMMSNDTHNSNLFSNAVFSYDFTMEGYKCSKK